MVCGAAGLLDIVQEPDRLAPAIEGSGIWGLVLFVVLMTILVAPGVPGIAFVLLASRLWSPPVAIGLVLVGGTAASSVRFFVVRRVGRAWIETRLPPRIRRWDERLATRGIWAVISLRLTCNMAAPADWVLGLSSVTTRQFLLGTMAGRTPLAVAWVLAGGALLGRAQVVIWFAAVGLASVAMSSQWRRRCRVGKGQAPHREGRP